jgi:hypothetical protein
MYKVSRVVIGYVINYHNFKTSTDVIVAEKIKLL